MRQQLKYKISAILHNEETTIEEKKKAIYLAVDLDMAEVLQENCSFGEMLDCVGLEIVPQGNQNE